jgi:hypothetical protein
VLDSVRSTCRSYAEGTSQANKSRSTSKTTAGASPQPDTNPRFLSTTGAFNGSGFATATASGASGELDLYFQHFTGQLRRLQLNGNTWSGGDINTIVATDAKNATPISVVAYSVGSVATVGTFPQYPRLYRSFS